MRRITYRCWRIWNSTRELERNAESNAWLPERCQTYLLGFDLLLFRKKSTESADWKSIVQIDSTRVFGFDTAKDET